MPLLVNDILAVGVPGGTSVVSLRQRILSDAALAGLQRALDTDSRADAVTIIDPTWNPGADAATRGLTGAFDAPFVSASTLDDQLIRPLATYAGQGADQLDGQDRQPHTARVRGRLWPPPARP